MSKEDHIRELNSLMMAVGRWLARSARRGFDRYPVNGPQFFLLRHVHTTGPVSISELAAGLGFDQSTISNVVNSLRKKGLVEKQKAAHDRRITLVELTPTGKDVVERVMTERYKRVENLLCEFPEEDLAHLVQLFRKLENGIESGQLWD